MKYIFIVLLLTFLCFNADIAAQKLEQKFDKGKPTIESKLDSVSYGLGVLLAINLGVFDDLDLAALARGIYDARKGEEGKTVISETKANALIQAHLEAAAAKKYEKTKKEGAAFLEANKNKEGVKVTASGLQYQVLKEGTGAIPTATDKVLCHYHGTLIDGTVFDSSVQRGQPVEFLVSGVIRGWVEALQLMKEGAKWKLFLPYDLAYGERGNQGIEPYSILIFEVELIKIKK